MNHSFASSETDENSTIRRRSPDGGPDDGTGFEPSPFATAECQIHLDSDFSPEPIAGCAPTTDTAPATSYGGFSPALPLYSDELGRLPVWSDESMGCPHSGAQFYNNQPPQSTSTTTLQSSIMCDSAPSGFTEETAQLDPDIEAIFAGLIPDGAYGYPFGLMS